MQVLAALCLLVATRQAAAIPVSSDGLQLRSAGYLDGLAVVATEDRPRERPRALLDLHTEAVPAARWLRGYLDLRASVGGPFERAHPGLFNLIHTFQNRSPSLEVNEAYAEVSLPRFEARAGVQKVAWGKLDGIPPSDVVNPRDFHDPFVQDTEERKIGVPALLGTFYAPDPSRLDLSDVRLTLIYIPLAVAPRLALLEERWFPTSIALAERVTIPKGVVRRAFMQPAARRLVVPVTLRTLNRRPPKRLDAGGIGARFGGTWRSIDWDIYHYSGPETAPDLDILARVMAVRRAPPGGGLPLRGQAELRQANDIIHMTAADWAAAVGGVTVRGEAAVFRDRPYLRRASDLFSPQALRHLPLRRLARQLAEKGRARVPLEDLFVNRDSVEWGLAADYMPRGYQLIAQVNQIALLESAPRLLIADPETRLSAIARRRLFDERLELEMRAISAIERGSWILFPRISYFPRDNWRVRVGYLAIGGPRASLLGQFAQNDEVVIQLRYSF